ncbi:prolyl aminopeptidase [Amycolatopsis sp. CA-230715]|uniref:prolyl aminopeptidase n=1 Tax=Amycolatopsis sp. CA-230715 TaxID=2745196 RepID=UPI001C03953B|nr:prolyl aminopeptidase [Amycolatopsis sp. CA-230715]QWF83644.1 Proline iminopeptidase [Amycolatopsis sp. CA-230715]
MTEYGEAAPFEHGMLDVGDGHRVYWEQCGNPDGKPAVVLHGGPGSGCTPLWRRFFDPARYRVLLFDQRGCGRSTPHAGAPEADLSANTTWHLLADIERLREHLGVEKWLVFGGSWGATLGLAYAERHPARVSELVLFSITNTSRAEVRWVTKEMRRFFPGQWARFRAGAPGADEDELAAGYARLLRDPDPAVHEKAAKDWCDWEDTHVSVVSDEHDPRYDDPVFRLCFARLVTHYWSNAAWLEDGALIRDATKLAGIPGVLVHGRLDISGPPDIAYAVAKRWPDAELRFVAEGGHGAGEPGMAELLVAATDRFAGRVDGTRLS